MHKPSWQAFCPPPLVLLSTTCWDYIDLTLAEDDVDAILVFLWCSSKMLLLADVADWWPCILQSPPQCSFACCENDLLSWLHIRYRFSKKSTQFSGLLCIWQWLIMISFDNFIIHLAEESLFSVCTLLMHWPHKSECNNKQNVILGAMKYYHRKATNAFF